MTVSFVGSAAQTHAAQVYLAHQNAHFCGVRKAAARMSEDRMSLSL
jgi:hypothetical protein